jgi:hypothetical protein
MLLFLMVTGDRFHEHDLCTHILCNLLNFKLPEMGGFNLQLTPSHRDKTILGGLDTFANFLAFAYINLHGFSLHSQYHYAWIH